MVHQVLDGLAPGEIRSYRLRRGLCSRSLRTFAGFSSKRSARRAISASKLLVGRLDGLLGDDGTDRGVGRTALAHPSRKPATNVSWSCPVASRYCMMLMPWGSRRCWRSCSLRSISCATSGPRLDRHEIRGGLEHLVRTASCACTLAYISSRLRASPRSSSIVSNSLTSEAHSSSASGSTFFFASFTSTRNDTRSAWAHPRRRARPGQLVVELEDVAGLLPAQLLIELLDDRSRPDLVEEVRRAQRVDGLAVDGALDVDLCVVAVGQGVRGVLEVGEALTQGVDLFVDRLIVDCRARDLDGERVVAGHLDDRAHLDDGVELDVASSSPAVMSISGGAMTSMSSACTASA